MLFDAKSHKIDFSPVIAVLHKKGGLLKTNQYRQSKIILGEIIQTEGRTKFKVTDTKGKQILIDYKTSANMVLSWANDKRIAYMNFRVLILDPKSKLTPRVRYKNWAKI